MKWQSAKLLGEDNGDPIVQVPLHWLHLHYYEALNILFRFENALRVFTYIVLKSHFLGKWGKLSLTNDDGKQTTILSISKRRKAQAEAFGYIGLPTRCPLMDLTSGELTRLILADSQWPLFRPYFLGSREAIKIKLDEISALRNSLAHFRPFRKQEIDTIKKNTLQVFRKVDATLEELLTLGVPIPTNSKAEWYGKLSGLQSDISQISLSQGKTGEWIAVDLSYSVEIIRASKFGSDIVDVSNIATPAILTEFPTLRDHIICLLDFSPMCRWNPPALPELKKDLRFIFHRRMLEEYCPDVEFRELRARLFEETEMVARKKGATGTLVTVNRIHAHHSETIKRRKYCLLRDYALCSPHDDAAAEFWGKAPGFPSMDDIGYVSGTWRFPWMTTDISEEYD